MKFTCHPVLSVLLLEGNANVRRIISAVNFNGYTKGRSHQKWGVQKVNEEKRKLTKGIQGVF